MDNELIEEAKSYFLKTVKEGNPDYPYFPKHAREVETWVKRILKNYPEADKEVLLLSVWLHDIGRAIGPKNIDHAVISEIKAKRFLSYRGLSSEKIEMVAHCIRAHRCKDVQPQTLEAKILAVADSASHMTDFAYIVMFQFMSKEGVIEKLERDYRDAGLLPKTQEKVTPLYKAWKGLLKEFSEYY